MLRLLAAMALTVSTSVFAQTSPLELTAPVEKVFIPNGFDDNDNAEIIIHGVFPDSCWRMGQSGAVVDENNMTIEVWATAYQHIPEATPDREVMCAQVLVPFITSIKTGVLKAGDYSVTVRDHAITSQLSVNPATTQSPDDYLYAIVNAAGLDTDPISQEQTLWVRGRHPRFFEGCMVIDEVRAYKDPADVLIVLPIARMEDGDACGDDYDFSFFKRVTLSDPVTEETLLHVRAMNGRSYNELLQPN